MSESYRNSTQTPSKNSVSPPVCPLCDSGWLLIPFQGRIVAVRCDCVVNAWIERQRQQNPELKCKGPRFDGKSAAAGEVA